MLASMKEQGITPEIIENSILRYEYNSDYTKKTLEQLMADKQKMIEGLDSKSPNYIHLVKKIEMIYDSIISNDVELQKQQKDGKKDMQQPGYSREENGTSYTEKQQQVLKDASGKEIGNRTITWNTDTQKGKESIETVGILENNDGNYSMREVSETLGGELQLHRREFTNHNKNTGEKEQYVYQKDSKGNETYFRTVNGKLTCKIVKTDKGFTIDTFDKGQPLDTFEYDNKGNAIFGMPGIDSISSDYVEHFFDSHVPYFEAENRELNMQQTVDTQKLGRESLDEQRDTVAKTAVESEMEEQMRSNSRKTQSQQSYYEQPETKTHSTDNPESFRSKMKFEMTQDQYQEVIDRHAAAEENFAKEMAENPDKKKTEQAERGVM